MKPRFLMMILGLLIVSFNINAIELKVDQDYVSDEKVYEEDYFFAGNFLDFKGKARDAFTFGEHVIMKGDLSYGLFSASRELSVEGTVGNGIKAAGRYVSIKGNSTGTNFLVGETVTFEKGSTVKGDTFVGARRVILNGELEGYFRSGAGEIIIQNQITGDVDVHAGRLVIADTGRINGNLVYHSDHKLTDEEKKRVSGEVKFVQKERGYFDDSDVDKFIDDSIWFSIFFKLAFAVMGFLLLLFPATQFLNQRFKQQKVVSHALWGLIPILVYPSATLLSVILVITIPLAISLALAFIPVLFITKLIGMTVIGGLIAEALKLNSKSRFLYFLIGVILFSLLSFIPYIGFVLLILVSSIGCGVLMSSLFQKSILK